MKKTVSIIAMLLVITSVMMSSCTPSYDKSPDQYSKIRWITPDYSFKFVPSDDCKGVYNYNGTKYNIKVNFDSNRLNVIDTDKNKDLFFADWMYEDGSYLYIYNITFNTKDYKELDGNYAEFMRLNQEKI